jgi:hypothetical protein
VRGNLASRLSMRCAPCCYYKKIVLGDVSWL